MNVVYAKDFGITDTKAELDKITAALELNIGGKFDTEAKKDVARLVMKDRDDEDIKEIIDDIDKRAEDMDYSEGEE